MIEDRQNAFEIEHNEFLRVELRLDALGDTDVEEFTIRCRANGPYVIEGNVRIVDHLGNVFTPPADKPRVALCRCGQSANKPFCDGAHKACGFASEEIAPPATTGEL